MESPWDHNAECRYCDEQGMHRADCSWLVALEAKVEQLEARLQIDPGGSDAIDGLQGAVDLLREQNHRLIKEREQLRERLAELLDESEARSATLARISAELAELKATRR